jgi:uncharacterized protein
MDSSRMKVVKSKAGASFPVRVIPRASRNEVVAILADGRLKIRLAAPPMEGKANAKLIEFLAEILDISSDQVEIIAGHTSRDKHIAIRDLTSQVIQEKILERVQPKEID